jgi:hypothetical protein
MKGFQDLNREYEAKRYPPTRRLDLHGEGPAAARERALRWIQSFAHEEPGAELLLVVERGGRPGARPGPVRQSVEKLLGELVGGLIEWWGPFASGSLAIRIAAQPRRIPLTLSTPSAADKHDGRTPETASAAQPRPDVDIPAELLPAAQQVAELRRDRDGLSIGLFEVVLRRVWIEAQAIAMSERLSFAAALERLLVEARESAYEEES